MNTPTYIPIFRLRDQEKGLLTSFDFGPEIFPYIEIFKKQPRSAPAAKPGQEPKAIKPFHQVYLPILDKINCEKMFVDLPVHLSRSRGMKSAVLEFLLDVVGKRELRTSAILSLKNCKKQIIPVVSTYSAITGELNSIKLQEADLRQDYPQLAFRTCEKTFHSDISQIQAVVKQEDFLFIDCEEFCLSNVDDLESVGHMLDYIKTFTKCTVVVINSPIHHALKNSELIHGEQILEAQNCLLERFRDFGADCFSDYAGVKKDLVEDGGGISPGLIFYYPIDNVFFGYRGRTWKPKEERHLEDIRGKILADLLRSAIVIKMKESHLQYLGPENKGWKMVKDMWDETEAWKSQSKLKRISMEHYLHSIKTKINAGFFLN